MHRSSVLSSTRPSMAMSAPAGAGSHALLARITVVFMIATFITVYVTRHLIGM